MDMSSLPTPAPDFERFRNVILRKEEGVPVRFFEIQIDPEIMATLLEEPVPSPFETDPEQIKKKVLQDIRLMHGLGYDYVTVWNMPILPGNFLLATDTANLTRGARPWQAEEGGPISSREDFEAFDWPDISKRKYTRFDFVSQHLPDGMKMIACIPGVFETIRGLIGVTGLCYLLHDDPCLVADAFEKVGGITLEAVKGLSAIEDVQGLVLAEDMGFKSDLMMAPEYFQAHVLPWHKEIGEVLHGAGKLYILHACGKIEKLMEDLMSEVGIDARHSFEDQVTSIEDAKQWYGDKIAVLGGVDMDLLARGTEADVRGRVREIVTACAVGGGFALGSGNSVANYVRPDNYLAMLDEGRRMAK